jgi:hypothetical protein
VSEASEKATPRDRYGWRQSGTTGQWALDAIDGQVFVASSLAGSVRIIVRKKKGVDGEGVHLRREQFAFLARMGFLAGAVGAPESDDDIRARLDRHEADLAEAAGELMVPLPEPGSVAAKLMRANTIMRRERDTLRALTQKLGYFFADYDRPRKDDGIVPRDACAERIDRLLAYEAEGVHDVTAIRLSLGDLARARRCLDESGNAGSAAEAASAVDIAARGLGGLLARAERRAASAAPAEVDDDEAGDAASGLVDRVDRIAVIFAELLEIKGRLARLEREP